MRRATAASGSAVPPVASRTQEHPPMPISQRWLDLFQLIPGYDPVKAAAPGDWFDEDEAELRCRFFATFLVHTKGRMAGRPYVLEPHEQAIIGSIFGWKRPDGTRRYREVFYFVPRKNSKSTLAAGIANCVSFMDREAGAEVYSVAAERDQAALVFDIAKTMVQQSPDLAARCRVYRKCIEVVNDYGIPTCHYKPISSDANTKHGYNTHCAICDELHAHRTPELVEVIQTSTGARTQPLIIHITTADFDRPDSICNIKYDYAGKVRDGVIDDPAFLPIIFEAHRDDDWTDPAVWARANPMLGKAFPLEYLQRECHRAQQEPAYENTFKRLHLNMRTEQDVRLIPMDQWTACGHGVTDAEAWREEMLERLIGRRCFAGLALGSTGDLTALALLFREENKWIVLPWFWIAEGRVNNRRTTTRGLDVDYSPWVHRGFITATEGHRATDYDRVRADIEALHLRYPMAGLTMDALFQGLQLGQDLLNKSGIEVTAHGQTMAFMAAPTKTFLEWTAEGKLMHGNNPVLAWQASCAAGKMDDIGNVKVHKGRSTGKVDGIVATIMAVGLATTSEEEQPFMLPVFARE
jgi:phage terminase large subunit-like protein